jgi:hypothetical protein
VTARLLHKCLYTMATSYDHITDAVMEETVPEKAGFLQELIENQLEMSSLETAASRAGIAQSSALWALGIMMLSDAESVRNAAFDRARDNPLDAALVAICSPNVDLAKSAAYFLTGFIGNKTVQAQDIQTISRMVDAVAARWSDVPSVREHLCCLIQKIGNVQQSEVPLHAAMQLFAAVTDSKQMRGIVAAIGELSVAGTRAAGVAESKAIPFLMAVQERMQFTVSDVLRKDLCWMLGNLACDGLWAEWMVSLGIHRSLVYMDSARVNAENVGALVNLVSEVKHLSNKEILRSDIMLTYVMMAHTGRFAQEAARAIALLTPS